MLVEELLGATTTSITGKAGLTGDLQPLTNNLDSAKFGESIQRIVFFLDVHHVRVSHAPTRPICVPAQQ